MTQRRPTRASLEADIAVALAQQQGRINAAYWAFTRQARALPPSSAVPDAYAARTRLQGQLRALQRRSSRAPRYGR